LFLKEFSSELKKPTKMADYSRFDAIFEALISKLDKTSVEVSDTLQKPLDEETSSTTQLTPPSSSSGVEEEVVDKTPPRLPNLLRKPQIITRNSDVSSKDYSPTLSPEVTRASTPTNDHILTAKTGPGGKVSRRTRKTLNNSGVMSSGDESSTSRKSSTVKKSTTKAKRRWDAEGMAVDGDDDEVLDYSAQNDVDSPIVNEASTDIESVRAEEMGNRTSKGEFILKDLNDEIDAIAAESKSAQEKSAQSTGIVGSSVGAISGYFKNIMGGKTLTREDLAGALKSLEQHLLEKNVAKEAAVRLCEGVERDLIGVKTASFTCMFSFPMFTRLRIV